MPSIRHVVCAAAALHLAGAAAWNFVSEDGLKDITGNNENVLVSFVWPSEHESKIFEEEWTAVEADAIASAAVDCEKNEAFCKKYDIASHPAIRLISSGKRPQRFRGERSAREILAFARRMLNPVVTTVYPSTTSEFLASDDVVVVLYLPETSSDDSQAERFTSVAEARRDRFSFGIERDSANDMNKRLVCHNNIDDLQHSTQEIGISGAIERFVVACARPLVGELTRRNELDYMKMPKSLVLYFTDSKSDRDTYTSSIRPLAKAYREYLVFLTVDTTEYPEMPVALGHHVGTKRGLSLQKPHATQVFVFEDEKDVTARAVEEFIVDISEGKISPWDRRSRGEERVRRHDEL